MTEALTRECAHCGSRFQDEQTKGRPRRYCSAACRAAASRERREHAHARELRETREQMVIPIEVESPAQRAVDALNELVRELDRGERPGGLAEVVEAARGLLQREGISQGGQDQTRPLDGDVAECGDSAADDGG